MFEIDKLVRKLELSGKDVSYNPEPLRQHHLKQWDELSKQPKVRELLSIKKNAECVKKMRMFCARSFSSLFTESELPEDLVEALQVGEVFYGPVYHCEQAMAAIDNLYQILVALIAQEKDEEYEILLSILKSLYRSYAVFNIRFKESSAEERARLIDLPTEFSNALILPNGYSYLISKAFKIAITPDPSIVRSSLHRHIEYNGIYYFEFNAFTAPSAEIFGLSLASQLVPDNDLFPEKSPCVLLSARQDSSKKQKVVYESHLIFLSLEEQGLTMQTLFYAYDAKEFFQRKLKVDQKNIPEILQLVVELALVHDIVEPRRVENLPIELMDAISDRSKFVLETHSSKRRSRSRRSTDDSILMTNTEAVGIIEKLIEKKLSVNEIYYAIKLIKYAEPVKTFEKLTDILYEVSPYFYALIDVFKKYRLTNAKQLEVLLDTMFDSIEPESFHLLMLVETIFIAHDVNAKNLLVSPKAETTDHIPAATVKYIDADFCMMHPPIERIKLTSRRTETLASPVMHFLGLKTVSGALPQYTRAPFSEQLCDTLVSSSPEQFILSVLIEANKYEQDYLQFIKPFRLPSAELENLNLPLKIAPAELESSFHILRRIQQAIAKGKRLPQDILKETLPVTAQIYTELDKISSERYTTWQDKIFHLASPIEETLGVALAEDKVEIGLKREETDRTHTFKDLIVHFLLHYLDLETLSLTVRSNIRSLCLEKRLLGYFTHEQLTQFDEKYPYVSPRYQVSSRRSSLAISSRDTFFGNTDASLSDPRLEMKKSPARYRMSSRSPSISGSDPDELSRSNSGSNSTSKDSTPRTKTSSPRAPTATSGLIRDHSRGHETRRSPSGPK